MNKHELLHRIDAGETFEYFFFWKGPFSQWEPVGFTVDGVYYKRAEHYMMAEKAKLFNDQDAWEKIIKTHHPRDVQSIGRLVKGFNQEVWDLEKYGVVYDGNFYKFTQNPTYNQILMDTGNKILVEASPTDTVWGIGLAEDHPDSSNPHKWLGENMLGFVLTDLRDYLRIVRQHVVQND